MSTSAKVIIWVIVAVVVIGGGLWLWSASQMNNQPTAYQNGPTSNPSVNGPTQNPPGSESNNGVSATSDSNAALQTDLNSVDSQMNGFSSDNTNVNQGFNDQPVQQQQL